MKNLKRLMLLAVLITAACLLWGCKNYEPMTIDTQLKINSNFDGERMMTAAIDKSTFNTLFDGDIATLQSMIEKYCPPEMSCTVKTTDNGAAVTMTIPFASYEEYQTKVYRILVNDNNPNSVNPAVYYDKSNNVFKRGYDLKESFKSADMFYWLTTAVGTEFPKLAEEDLSALYKTGKNELIYNNEVFETEEYIAHSSMVSNGFTDAVIETKINDDGSLDGTVRLTIDREDASKISDLDALIDAVVPTGGFGTTILKNLTKTYEITFTSRSEADYVKQLNKIFHSDHSVFEITQEQDANETLKARKYVKQYVDGSYYIDFNQENTNISYVVRLASGYTLENCASANKYIQSSNYDYTDDYTLVTASMSPSDEITFSFGADVPLDKIDVYTKILSNSRQERQIIFTLSKEQDELIGESFKDRIEARITDEITLERTELENKAIKYIVTIKASGAAKMSELTCAFLDGDSASAKSSLEGGLAERNSLHKIHYAYSDVIDFTKFLSTSQAINGIEYVFEYPDGYAAKFKDASAYEDVSQSQNTLSCLTYNKTISVESSAEKTNINGILQQLLWYLSLAAILIILLFNLPGLIRCIKSRTFSAEDMELFTKKGYMMISILAVAGVIFVITSIRLLFGVY